MNVVRRRSFSVHDDAITIYHPNYLYFEVKTTSANQNIAIWYAERVADTILNGEHVNIGYYSYQMGGITIPEPGYHKIYVKPNHWSNSSAYYRVGNSHYTILCEGNTNIYATCPLLKTLICLSSTPPTVTNSQLPAIEHIYVPKEAEAAYKQSWPYYAQYIKGVNFNIIPD